MNNEDQQFRIAKQAAQIRQLEEKHQKLADQVTKQRGYIRKLIRLYEQQHDDARPFRPLWAQEALSDDKTKENDQ